MCDPCWSKVNPSAFSRTSTSWRREASTSPVRPPPRTPTVIDGTRVGRYLWLVGTDRGRGTWRKTLRPAAMSRDMPRSPSIRVRPAVPSDLRACARVFVRSAGHLARRLGEEFTAPPLRDMAAALGHILSTHPFGLHVATAQGRIVAFAATIVRGRTHFLSMFWALPDIQGRGVGRRVLARAFAAPKKPRGAVRCVYASLDTRAQVLYLKFGMQPRSMIYRVTGKVRRSPRPVKVPTLVQVGPVGPSTKEQRDIAARYDRGLRLARRDADHVFLGKAPGARFFEARYRGRRVGYVCLY